MSTRGIIVFVGKSRFGGARVGYRLYQHCDSYPTHSLELIRDSIRDAKKLVKKANTSLPLGTEYHVLPETLAGLYTGHSTSVYGIGARIEHTEREFKDFSLLGNQEDLEWAYIVDTVKRSVEVLGGGYTGKGPETFRRTDPLGYSDALQEEYQKSTYEAIDTLVRSLKALGWPVNPKGRRGRGELN